jgi:hypothetical protein
MKTVVIITLIVASVAGLVYLSGCSGCGKKGNGNVVTEERQVKPFTHLTIQGVFPVELSQNGDKEYVKVQTDANLQQYITVQNDGDELIIKTDKDASISRTTKLKVYVNIRNIKTLEFSSVGNLTTANDLKLDSLELNSESVGKLSLGIRADFLRANLNAVGSTTLSGAVREARINNKSVGTLSAYDLKAGTLMIHNTAVGTAEVYADSVFYIRSEAIGMLYYKGPGQVKELESSGIGKVQKKD